MDNMNNDLNNNNQNNQNNFTNPNIPEGTPIQGINFGAVIGLVVLIGIIIGSVVLFNNAYNKFNEVSGKLEELSNNIPQIVPGEDLDDGKDENVDNQEDNNTDEEVAFDPYAKYKDIKWSGTKDTVKNITLYIENGKVYSKDTDNGIKTEWKTVGTAKKILFDPPAVAAIIVTEEGKAYDISYDVCEEIKELSKYTIVDMAYLNNYTYEKFYFLTSDGKLIDRYGVSYDKYAFVNRIEFGKMWWIPVDKNNYGYHWNNEKNVYEVITNSSKSKLAFSKVYAFDEYVLIQTAHGKLFKYEYSSVAKQESDLMVSRVERKVSGDNTSLVVTFMDLSTKEYKEPIGGFDVKSNKEIDIDKLNKYVEQPKIEVPDLSGAIEELEKLSDSLRRLIIAAYDGKTLTGVEIIAACQQYETSDMSIMVVTNENGTAYTGKYRLNKNNLKLENSATSENVKEHKAYEGGVYYIGSASEFDTNVKRNSLTELQSVNGFGINASKIFYSSIIKDVDGDAFGILFLER